MNDEELIVNVQEYKFLYDLGDPQYHNQLTRENAWEEIGGKMGVNGEKCKERWKALRECYRKALKKRETKSGQAAKKHKPWRLEAQIEFIKSFVTAQSEQISNFETSLPTPSTSQVGEIEDESTVDEQLDSPSSGHTTPVNRNTQSRKSTTSAQMFQQFMEYKKSKQSHQSDQKSDHLTKYFQGVEATVRTFPPSLQIKIKSPISNILHNAEFEAITMNSSSLDNSPNPHSSQKSQVPSLLSFQPNFTPTPSTLQNFKTLQSTSCATPNTVSSQQLDYQKIPQANWNIQQTSDYQTNLQTNQSTSASCNISETVSNQQLKYQQL